MPALDPFFSNQSSNYLSATSFIFSVIDPSTHCLLSPFLIRSNMLEAHGQVLQLIEQEYTEEDMKIIQAKSTDELSSYLDSMS